MHFRARSLFPTLCVGTGEKAKARLEKMIKKPLSLDEALSVLKKRKAEFHEAYGVIEIGIFGSIVRGEAKRDSNL